MSSMMEASFSAPMLRTLSVAAVVHTIHEVQHLRLHVVQHPHFDVEVVRLGPIRHSVGRSRSPRVRGTFVCLGC